MERRASESSRNVAIAIGSSCEIRAFVRTVIKKKQGFGVVDGSNRTRTRKTLIIRKIGVGLCANESLRFRPICVTKLVSDVGHQSHKSSAFDRRSDRVLANGGATGLATANDFALTSRQFLEKFDVFVIDEHRTHTFAVRAQRVASLAANLCLRTFTINAILFKCRRFGHNYNRNSLTASRIGTATIPTIVQCADAKRRAFGALNSPQLRAAKDHDSPCARRWRSGKPTGV